MKIEAAFVTSAASAAGLPREPLPEVAMVGRSNVGKSSLINALAGQRVARTSAAPGKTRLANVYRMRRGSRAPIFLVDLPGYGYARGGRESAQEFARLAREYFLRAGREGPTLSALLLVDARHAAMASDLEAWQWLGSSVPQAAVVATKVDKLARGERIHALRELESAFDEAVLPVSAVTGEGLDELWKLIDRLANSPNPTSSSPREAGRTAPPPTSPRRLPRPRKR